MINISTVLVLGAGASRHCGYPLGQSLYSMIIESLDLIEALNLSDIKESDFSQYPKVTQLFLSGYDTTAMLNLRQALKYADRPSIDRFLERRSDLMDIGKLCIAQTLIPYETKKPITNRSGNNWYQHLFEVLDTKPAEFSKNKLSIITFNYDRSLEHYLFNAIKYAHGITDDKEVTALLSSIPIVHVHGQLGLLPWQANARNAREYGGSLTQGGLIEASKSIKIIHEDITKDPEIDKAKQLIKQSERTFFLGFGYDPTNLQRLGIDQSGHNNFVGTGMGLSYNTLARTREEFERMKRSITINADQDIVTFFKVTRF